LRQLSRRHEAILNEVPDIIVEVDARKVYTWANPAGCAFFGDEVIGKEAAYYFEGEQDTYGQVQPLFSGESRVFYVESWQRRKDGERRLLAWWCQAVKDANGQVVGALSTARDVTDHRRMEESLRQSEARLRQAAEAGNVGLWDWDLGNNRVYYSPEWKRQIGYEDHEISDDFNEWESRVHPDDRGPSLQTIRSFVENPRPGFEIEFRFRHKDGSYRWILAKGSFVYDAGGKACRMLGSHVDITDRKRAEEAIKESEERLRLFIEHAPAALAMFDPEMRYLAVSRRWLSDYHLQGSHLIGRSHYEVFPEIPDELKAIHRRGMNGEVVKGDDDRLRRADGSVQRLRWEMRPWKTADGSIGGILIFSEDITERKEAEARLNRQLEELRRWHDVTLGRESRIIDLKCEVNELSVRLGQAPRYPSTAGPAAVPFGEQRASAAPPPAYSI
jgi:PAS domain S-box-containing protein